MVRVGDGCVSLHDEMMRGLVCERLQLDEIWAYVGMKQKQASKLAERGEFGDAYTFVGLDADTKLVVSYRVARRTWNDTQAFIEDLRGRITNRPQITTGAFAAYYGAIMRTFEGKVDYAQLHKVFASELNTGRGRYSPPSMIKCEREPIIGQPDRDHISTSYVERQNLRLRMQNRRFTRLTNAFSKKLANLKASVALHFAHYNLCRVHKTLRVTPAMAASVADHIWTVDELIAASTEQAERLAG